VTSGLAQNSTSLTVADTSNLAVGELMQIDFQNQTGNTAIQSGATPIISVSGYAGVRSQVTRITAISGATVKFFPGIYHSPDAGLTASVTIAQGQSNLVGIENLAIDMTNSTAPFPIEMEHTYACWLYNVKISNVPGYGPSIYTSLNDEVRHCQVLTRQVTGNGGTNGAGLMLQGDSGFLVADNIFYNIFPLLEVDMACCGNVIAYNLFENPPLNGSIYFAIDTNHEPHNAFNLYEGNIAPNLISDGYFGSDSEETVFRNWLHGSCLNSSCTTYTLSLKRFSRKFSIVGNVLGKNGVTNGSLSYGQPNIGNPQYRGSAQPSKGVFWNDWKATASVTSPSSITINSGSISVGQIFTVWWNTTNYWQAIATAVSNGVVSFSGGSGTPLPATGTALTLFTGPPGYQELDLDVQGTVIDKGNYLYGTTGAAGSMSSLGGDTLPASLFLVSKPSWFGSLAWPPFDPANPNASSYAAIPAGYRFANNGAEAPGVGSSAPPAPGNLHIASPSASPSQ
jgi:hypothetical protein